MSKPKPGKHDLTDFSSKFGPTDDEVKAASQGAMRVLELGNELLLGFESVVDNNTTAQVVRKLWEESQNIGNEPKDRIKALEIMAKLSQGINDIRMRTVIQYTQTMQVIAAAKIHSGEASVQNSDSEIGKLLAAVNPS